MIVRPEIIFHPKFLALEDAVGVEALKFLVRIWGHCEQVKGSNWGPVNATYVEKVAGFRGRGKKAGMLFAALVDPFGNQRPGWIEVDGKGDVLVHDWAEVNSGLINARKAGSIGGTHKALGINKTVLARLERGHNAGIARSKPGFSPALAYGEERMGEDGSTSLPSCEAVGKSGEERAAEIPTVEEMFQFFQARGAGVTREVCELYEKKTRRTGRWLRRNGLGQVMVAPWQEEVPEWQLRQREWAMGMTTSVKNGAINGESELEDIGAELQWQKDPLRVKELVNRRKELRGV